MSTDSQTMENIEDLIHQQEQIAARIKKAKEDQKAGVIEQIRNLVSVHDVTAEEIYGRGGRVKGEGKAKSGGKVPPKYRDPVSGATWTGRGRSPVWIADKDRSKFLIA